MAELRRHRSSLAAVGRAVGLKRQTMYWALISPHIKANAAIADALGLPLCELWPDWFDEDGKLVSMTPQPRQRPRGELKEAEQRKIALRIKSGEAKSVSQAKVVVGLAKPQTVDPQARIHTALLENWEKASKHTRAAFLRHVGAEMTKHGAQSV